MRRREVQGAASDPLPEVSPWFARLIDRLTRKVRLPEINPSDPCPGRRTPVWEDPWIDLGGEG
jgi:hypothetical protein